MIGGHFSVMLFQFQTSVLQDNQMQIVLSVHIKAAAANTYISIFISTAHKERTGWRRGLLNLSGFVLRNPRRFVLRNPQGFVRLVYSSLLSICPRHQVSWRENTFVTVIFAHCTTMGFRWHQTWGSVTAYSSGKCPPQKWRRVLLSWK